MAIEMKTVRHIAHLANLDFTEEELRLLSRQLNSILVYMEKLNELNTDQVEPTSHVTRLRHAYREDGVVPSIPVSRALANAPESKEGYFTVPKVLG